MRRFPPDIALRAHPGYTLTTNKDKGGPHDPTHPPLAARRNRRSVRDDTAAAPAHAAAPAADKQAPGFYRYKVGSYEITVVTDVPTAFRCPTTSLPTSKKTKSRPRSAQPT
jgi:hypothetical protein